MNGGDSQPQSSLSDRIEAAKRQAGITPAPEAPQADKAATSSPSVGKGMHLGLELAVSTLVCTFLGVALDKTFHTAPLFILLGLVLGMGAGIWHMYRVALGIDAATVGIKPVSTKVSATDSAASSASAPVTKE